MYKKELQFAIHFVANILFVIYFLADVEFIENQKNFKYPFFFSKYLFFLYRRTCGGQEFDICSPFMLRMGNNTRFVGKFHIDGTNSSH